MCDLCRVKLLAHPVEFRYLQEPGESNRRNPLLQNNLSIPLPMLYISALKKHVGGRSGNGFVTIAI